MQVRKYTVSAGAPRRSRRFTAFEMGCGEGSIMEQNRIDLDLYCNTLTAKSIRLGTRPYQILHGSTFTVFNTIKSFDGSVNLDDKGCETLR